MFSVFKNAWKLPELRKKILYTLLMLLVYRLCCFIPTPGINPSLQIDAANDSIWGLMNIITGGSLQGYHFMAMGISPYINASIIIQLLQVVIPALERLGREEDGREKINKIVRYTSFGLAFLQAVGICYAFSQTNDMFVSGINEWLAYIIVGLSLTAGTAVALWIGDRISEKGLGNGISMLIFVGIIARFPVTAQNYVQTAAANSQTGNNALWWILPIVLVAIVALIIAVVFVELGERRINIQYAKRVSGRKVYGGQSTYMPIKPNSCGVLPLIFSMSLLMFPSILTGMFWAGSKFETFYTKWLGQGTWGYLVVSFLLTIGFAYFYSAITFNAAETSKNLQKYGGFIQGIRPGKPTTDYLNKVSKRLVLFSGLYLGVISSIPMLASAILSTIPNFDANTVLSLALTFSSTGLLIIVSVAIEITKQLESQMVMRHYKGFLD
ncbi:MAG: preprotein translocase subunit SecY [Clostridiales bacterium]|nr:preprotein translocase subunit SecY [Clostridiales bacterium]